MKFGYDKDEHLTSFISVGVKGRGDIEKIRDIIYRNFDKIVFEFNGDILCKDYASGEMFGFSEIG